MKDVKIIIGANYGDEGKGLVTRHFVTDAMVQNKKPIVILHNGTAQRGHTIDYSPALRHVYHHFGSGTGDGVSTFFANTFWIHPMEFHREYEELEMIMSSIPNITYDPNCFVITPFDMLVDHATEAYIQWEHNEREFGSCGLGTWCATDRFPSGIYTIEEWIDAVIPREHSRHENYYRMMDVSFNECFNILRGRGVDLNKIPQYKKYFDKRSGRYKKICYKFLVDLNYFRSRGYGKTFNQIYNKYDSLIFENGQGLGLDKNISNEWRTTSNTGINNPAQMLKEKENFNAEVCYVTRSYLTRHGNGPLEEEVQKFDINPKICDNTNVDNDFQGSLRYGYLDDFMQKERIKKDWELVENDNKFNKTIAVTHCNEFEINLNEFNYVSFNPYSIIKQ